MNERAEEILKEGLSEEQSNWMLRSFYEISFDSSAADRSVMQGGFWDEAHPTTSLCKAIDFDRIAKLYCNAKGLSYRCNSSDALYIVPSEGDEQPEIYWIEFKNGMITEKLLAEINEKISCELIILQDVDSLNAGMLDVSDMNSPILKEGIPRFEFGNKLRRLGIPDNKVSFEQQHAHFILVYNETNKLTLLSSDIESICDAIERGEYARLVASLEKTRTVSGVADVIGGDAAERTSEVLKKYLRHKALGKKKQWFEDFQRVFDLLGDCMDGKYDKEEEKWAALSDEECGTIIQRLENYRDNEASGIEKNGLDKMISLLKKINTHRMEKPARLVDLFSEMLNLSPTPAVLILKELKKYVYLEELENGGYDSLLDLVKENPVLMPYDFSGSEEDYLRFRIGNGTFEEFLKDCSIENQYDATHFLNVSARITVWPTAFFRLGMKSGFWYKDAKTYSRQEFKEKFIDDICGATGDRNVMCFAESIVAG